jgi:tRNA pseudouridine55 synthase
VTGLFLVDKPAGPTSFGVLRSLRPALGPKLGHAGTLDPFASGLLLVLAGRATRLAAYLSGLDKSYRAVVQFGAVSTTLDTEGKIETTGRRVDMASVLRAAAGLTGTVTQRVPAASAVKVRGERAYRRMRRGETVEPPARQVRIDRLEVEAFDESAQQATIGVDCSKGTYIRQIAFDLGEATAAGAYCAALRRLGAGPFTVADAGTPEQVTEHPEGRWWRTPADALPHLAARELSDDEVAYVVHGRRIGNGADEGPVRLVREGRLVAVGELRDGELQPVVVLEG